jgi:16S rRNA (adenine1518-N6/adenine1519-N6)-dimethyltransferase
MPLYRPSELSEFLHSIEHAPKRTLSQNFLVDGNIVAKIIAEACPFQDSLVVEIGPGPGVLTEAFLAAGATVVAIEKDDVFAYALRRLDPGGKRLSVIAADILNCSFPEIVVSHGAKDVVIVSNLPYHLTTPIIQKLMENAHLFSRAILMVLEEVARRLTDGKSSFVGCLAAFFADVRYGFHVPKGCFWPRPKVDSAILTLHFHTPLIPKGKQEQFLNILRMAFAYRRKTVLHSLQQAFTREGLTVAFRRIELSLDSRPEELALSTWVKLFLSLESSSSP